jgi:hypothetical protein
MAQEAHGKEKVDVKEVINMTDEETQTSKPTYVPEDELRALIEADTLHLLPTSALIATIKNLAEHLLVLQNN